MANGQSTKRSYLDAEHLVQRLQERGVEQLRSEEEVWAIVDGSELRKPYARQMEDLMRVRALEGKGTAPGLQRRLAVGEVPHPQCAGSWQKQEEGHPVSSPVQQQRERIRKRVQRDPEST